MANTRTISFATEPSQIPSEPLHFFYRLHSAKAWSSLGLQSIPLPDLQKTLSNFLDAICSSPTRAILRTDDGSGKEVSVEGLVRVIEQETVIGNGNGKLESLYVVVYPKNPIGGEDRVGTSKVVVEEREKGGCCDLQVQ
jgi:hypothetical protein